VGESCSVNRVAKIMRQNSLRDQIGYKRRYIKGSTLSRIAVNVLERDFSPNTPNIAWVSDITYVRTYEGFLYLATVIDFFSRRVVGWSMNKNMDKHLVIGALFMAVYQRRQRYLTLQKCFTILKSAIRIQAEYHLLNSRKRIFWNNKLSSEGWEVQMLIVSNDMDFSRSFFKIEVKVLFQFF
jgi:transposase InsO family protein